MYYGYFAFTRLSLDTIKKSIYIELSKITRILCAESSFSQFAARKQGRTYAECASL